VSRNIHTYLFTCVYAYDTCLLPAAVSAQLAEPHNSVYISKKMHAFVKLSNRCKVHTNVTKTHSRSRMLSLSLSFIFRETPFIRQPHTDMLALTLEQSDLSCSLSLAHTLSCCFFRSHFSCSLARALSLRKHLHIHQKTYAACTSRIIAKPAASTALPMVLSTAKAGDRASVSGTKTISLPPSIFSVAE